MWPSIFFSGMRDRNSEGDTMIEETRTQSADLIETFDPVYSRVTLFLYREAQVLDRRELDLWAAMLAEDIRYSMPVRVTKSKGQDDIDESMGHFEDNYLSLMARLGRLKTKSAWAEDPASRTRRIVSNILVSRTEKTNEYQVSNYLLLLRNRFEEPEIKQLSCERRDRLRFEGPVTRICRREIIVDQAVLGMSNLAVFL
jgi:3-phenylpropionate/cinnamic acid dioxygenase small subunit